MLPMTLRYWSFLFRFLDNRSSDPLHTRQVYCLGSKEVQCQV